MDEIRYETRLRSERKEPVNIYEGKRILCTLEPNETRTFTSTSPSAMLAKYTEMTFLPDGALETVLRKDWVQPDLGPYSLEVLNESGNATEERTIAGQALTLMRGIPIRIATQLTDAEVVYSKILIRRGICWIPSSAHADYLVQTVKVSDVPVPRSDKELGEIQAELAKLTDEEKVAPEAEKTPAEGDKPVGIVHPAQDVSPEVRARLGL